jgi:hypothetical protein
MKRKLALGTILALSVAFIVSAACVAPAFASVTSYAHACASGGTVIDIPGHQPATKISVAHYDGGDKGVADYLEVSTWQFFPPLNKFVWKTVAIVTDSPSTAAFLKDFVFAGLPGAPITFLLVKRCALQVYRIGKTVFAYWTVPIASPAVTLPPGCLLFRGYGCAQTNHEVWKLPNGVTLTQDSVGFAAHATFVCLAWKYWGAVGDEDTTIGTDVDLWSAVP